MDCFINYHTDIGTGRMINQDSFAAWTLRIRGKRAAVLIVCDGMGGLSRGELASKEAVCAFERWVERGLPGLLREGMSEERLQYDWCHMLDHINRQLLEYGRKHGIELGTTLTAVLFWEGRYYAVHVGDCRLYAIDKRCVQLTKDQTLAEYRRASGTSGDGAEHVLMQCVGGSGPLYPEFLTGEMKAGRVYLLCTDGFRRKLKPYELQEAMRPDYIAGDEDLKNRMAALVSRVKKRGETDNITALAIKVC